MYILYWGEIIFLKEHKYTFQVIIQNNWIPLYLGFGLYSLRGFFACFVWFFQWSTTHYCDFSSPNIRQSDFSAWNLCERISASHLLFSRYRITPGTDLVCSFTFKTMWFIPRHKDLQGSAQGFLMTLNSWKLLQGNLKHEHSGLHTFMWVMLENGCVRNLQNCRAICIILGQVNSHFPREAAGEGWTNTEVMAMSAAAIQRTGQAGAANAMFWFTRPEQCVPMPRWPNGWGEEIPGIT